MKLTQAWTLIVSSAIAVGAFVPSTYHRSPITSTTPISNPISSSTTTAATYSNINTLNKKKQVFSPLRMSDSATIVDAETVDESAETFE